MRAMRLRKEKMRDVGERSEEKGMKGEKFFLLPPTSLWGVLEVGLSAFRFLGRKGFLGFISLLFLFSLARAQSDVPPDVPPGHWAREAVEYLVGKGYLVGFPDGTFRGNEPVTRYQLALVLYRLLASYPQIVWDDDALAKLRSLLKELAPELRRAEEEEGKGQAQPFDTEDYRAYLVELSERIALLEENLAQSLPRTPEGEVPIEVADLVIQMALLKERLSLLEAGELPQGLAQALYRAIKEAMDSRLTALETRLSALESRLKDLEATVASEQSRLRNELEGVKKTLAERSFALEKAVDDLRAERQETALRLSVRYQVGVDPAAPGAPEGLYVLSGLATYDPARKEGYEALGGRTPTDTLVGVGYLRGEGSEGVYLQGLYAPSGAFGFSIRGWSAGEAGYLKGELSFRNAQMPLYIVPGYSGGVIEGAGEAGGGFFSLKAWGLITAQGTVHQEVASSGADPCAKTAYGAIGTIRVPFGSFRVDSSASYRQESRFAPSCAVDSFGGYTYEIGLAHDPTSEEAIVPGLGLSVYYGGHEAALDGVPFGLSYWGVKASYLLDLGGFRAMLGGGYKSFTPSGNHNALPPGLIYQLYPAPGREYGGSLVLAFGGEESGLQLEVDYRRAEAGSAFGTYILLAPSLRLSLDELSGSLAYRYGVGVGWDPYSPNPLLSGGVHYLSEVEGKGKLGGWNFSVVYSFTRALGKVELGYQLAW